MTSPPAPTSRSTRIIHGGLRYLKHGEIGMVRESLRERQRLLRERPHLVHPVHFLLALNQSSREARSAYAPVCGYIAKLGGRRLGANLSKADLSKVERPARCRTPLVDFQFRRRTV